MERIFQTIPELRNRSTVRQRLAKIHTAILTINKAKSNKSDKIRRLRLLRNKRWGTLILPMNTRGGTAKSSRSMQPSIDRSKKTQYKASKVCAFNDACNAEAARYGRSFSASLTSRQSGQPVDAYLEAEDGSLL